jgi:general stress protein YciG
LSVSGKGVEADPSGFGAPSGGDNYDEPVLHPGGGPVQVRMTRADAGRKGGLTTKKRYGADFYQRIGRKGGKKGGLTTKQRYGADFYRTIGRKGGSR